MAVRLHGTVGSWLLSQGETVLGRGKDCGLRIDDSRLSRRHARFILDGHDLEVEDLGSTNGVTVNGQRISGSRRLQHGDVVVCGPCVLMLSVDQTMPHPRGVVGAQDPSSKRPHGQADDTDHLDPAPNATRDTSGSRGLNPAIAAAMQPEAPADPQRQSVLQPVEAPGSMTGPLDAIRPGGAKPQAPSDRRRSTTGVEAAPFRTDDTGALAPLPAGTGLVLGLRRALAGVADCCQTFGFAGALALPVFAAGYGLGLVKAGAVLVDGLPQLVPGIRAGWLELSLSLFTPGGFERAGELVVMLQRIGSPGFLMAFIGASLATLVVVLVVLLGTVAATVLHGAPFWHRALGLVIVSEPDHAYLGWGRACIRWLLTAILWPLAIPALFRERRAPHDLISGCTVHRRR